MKITLFALFILSIPLHSFAAKVQVAYVYTTKASLWPEPGYSWRDCQRIDKGGLDNLLGNPQNMEAELQALRVCEKRGSDPTQFPSAGDKVFLLPDPATGRPQVQSRILRVARDGEMEDVMTQFYKVEVEVNGQKKIGWIAEDQLTVPEEPADDEPHAEPAQTPKPKDDCPPETPGNATSRTVITQQQDAQSIVQAASNELDLGGLKDEAAIDKFMCMYRDNSITNAQFPEKMRQFKAAAKSAEAAFGLPYSIIMCTMLVESGLKHRENESDPYRGYGQFGSPLVEDLQKEIRTTPYKSMWETYQASQPTALFTDRKIRRDSDPVHATAAVALAMRWIYDERIPAAGCRECSTGQRYNKRDLYLMIAGYNYSPFGLGKIANKTLWSLRNSAPPPRETRNYMVSMERCMQEDQVKKFRVADNDARTTESTEYVRNREFCQNFSVR